mgnify:CR=1 FL=1
MNRQPLQNDDQQSILCLVQQVSLYKELLAQISYQNQLLSRDINIKQQQQGNMSQFGGGNNMNYMNLPGMEMSNSGVNNNMNSLGTMNSMNNLNNLNNLSSLANSMGNMNLQSLQPNMINSTLILI